MVFSPDAFQPASFNKLSADCWGLSGLFAQPRCERRKMGAPLFHRKNYSKKRPDLNDRAHSTSPLQKNNFTPNVMLRIPPLNNFWFKKFGSNGNAYPGVVVAVTTPELLNTLPLLKL